ncbi:MAG: hypothetical protein JSV65_10935 [Armatimonadota bacterium]|nr:MAG: hypothetical protein JSV65_10935 [Armatimonadota bacterium]
MPDVPMCEHRRVELGRLYCDLATRRGERATNETFNRTCEMCRVVSVRAAHPCAHLDVGVDLTEHRERSTLDAYHLACRVTRLDVGDAEACTPECQYFEPIAEDKREEYEAAAAQRERAAQAEAAQRTGRRADL